MGIPRFIKLPGHKQFNYSPRYWDPEKEEREERIRQIKQEMGVEVPSDPNRTTIRRGSFRQRRTEGKSESQPKFKHQACGHSGRTSFACISNYSYR